MVITEYSCTTLINSTNYVVGYTATQNPTRGLDSHRYWTTAPTDRSNSYIVRNVCRLYL